MFASVGLANGSVKVSLGFAYTEHLKPSFIPFSEVLHKVSSFNVPRWTLALGEVDQTCVLGARDVTVAGATLSLGRRCPRLGAHSMKILSSR